MSDMTLLPTGSLGDEAGAAGLGGAVGGLIGSWFGNGFGPGYGYGACDSLHRRNRGETAGGD